MNTKQINIITMLAWLAMVASIGQAAEPVHGEPSRPAIVLNGDSANLERGFKAPPASAKPFVFWFWMGEAVTKEGITADLEAMARFGIGGYIIFHAGGYQAPDLPNPNMLSPEWFELFKHAMQESERLGLEGGINNCPGYATDGGPWVTPEFGQQEVVWSEAIVNGGGKVATHLPEPAVKYGWGRKFNYSDIATVAIPLPDAAAQDFRGLVKTVTCSGAPEQAKIDESVYKCPDIKVDFLPENPDARALVDGRLDTGFQVPPPSKDNPLVIEYEMSEPFTARGFEIDFLPVTYSSPQQAALLIEADTDGTGYQKVGEFALQRSAHSHAVIAPRHFLKLDPVVAKKFRVTFSDASLSHGSKQFRLSEAVFHSLPREPLAKPISSSLRIRDVKYERSKEPGKPLGFDAGQAIDLTAKMGPDGTLDWDAPPGRWLVIRFGHSCTGQANHPPPTDMNGLEIDKLSKEAYDLHWEKGIQPYIDAVGDLAGRVFTTIHRDSPECGDHHWTPKMPGEFERRRGYSILPFLPVFAGVALADQNMGNRFSNELKQTLADLTHEYNYDYSHELIRKSGMRSSSEAYSRVFSSSIAPRTADIPMSEVWLWSHHQDNPTGREFAFNTDATRTMAGVSQQHGQRFVGCEAFTQGKYPDYWAVPYEDHPGSAKWRGDQMMADGVNRFYIHDFTHQPYLDRAPGVTYAGWGWNFDRNQTWWNLGSGAGAYWARCHWMLQEGKTVYDICIWSPNETWYCVASFPAKKWKFGGYDHMFLGNDVLMARGAVDCDGYFTTGPGLRYRILIGVENQSMSLAELRKLTELIEGGAVFVGSAPKSPKGLMENEEEFRKLVSHIWGGVDLETGKSLGKGHVYALGWDRISKGPEHISEYLQGIIAKYQIPDFEVPGEPIRGRREGFTYQHRRSADAEWFFVSNQKQEAKRVDCIFRVSGKHPELWNPLTGATERLDEFEVLPDGRLRVPIAFDPDGACFVVFRQPLDHSRQIVSVTGNTNPTIANGHLRASTDGKWEIAMANGNKQTVEIKGLPEPLTIRGPWQVSFQANRGGPAFSEFAELKSWSEHSDPAIRFYSGEAVYQSKFSVPGGFLAKNRRLYLDLGEVGVIAGVTLNGRTFPPLWTPPFRLDVTDALKAGENELEIQVANTWINRIIGSLKNPADSNSIIFTKSGKPDDRINGLTKDSQVMWTNFPITYVNKDILNAETDLPRSGLIGPVRLVAEGSVALAEANRP